MHARVEGLVELLLKVELLLQYAAVAVCFRAGLLNYDPLTVASECNSQQADI
jgi:hypothetical protein